MNVALPEKPAAGLNVNAPFGFKLNVPALAEDVGDDRCGHGPVRIGNARQHTGRCDRQRHILGGGIRTIDDAGRRIVHGVDDDGHRRRVAEVVSRIAQSISERVGAVEVGTRHIREIAILTKVSACHGSDRQEQWRPRCCQDRRDCRWLRTPLPPTFSVVSSFVV